MASFANDIARSTDATFRNQVQAALYKSAIAVIGEASSTPGRDDRHALMTVAVRDPARFVPWFASLVAAEASIRAVDMPTGLSDATVEAAFIAIINDAAGVKAA